MIKQVERIRETEQRTRSELVREALRTYFTRSPAYSPTRAQLRAIERGRAALRRGEYVTLHELRSHVGGESKQTRAKRRPARASG